MTTAAEISALSAEPVRLLGTVSADFTGVTEYGVSLRALLAGQAQPPPAGARFDVAFEGTVDGPALGGRIVGTDHLYLRADGRMELHVHGRVTTPGGVNVAFLSEAAHPMKAGDPALANVLARVSLYCASPDYAWVNALAPWSIGTIDSATGTIRQKLYTFP